MLFRTSLFFAFALALAWSPLGTAAAELAYHPRPVFDTGASEWRNITDIAINDRGDVAISTWGDTSAIVFIDRAGAVTELRSGPEFGVIDWDIDISNAGTVAFTSDLGGGSDRGLFLLERGTARKLTQAALLLGPALGPGDAVGVLCAGRVNEALCRWRNGELSTLFEVENGAGIDGSFHDMNAAGTVVAAWNGSAGERGFVVAGKRSIDLVTVDRGSGGGGGEWPTVNSSNQVAHCGGGRGVLWDAGTLATFYPEFCFSADINEAGHVAVTSERGLFVVEGGTARAVLHIGQPLFGSTLNAVWQARLNNGGAVAFIAILGDGREVAGVAESIR